MEIQNLRFEIKSLDESGQFEGVVSVYGVRDKQNDAVSAGAFTKTLKEGGRNVPLLWQHDVKEIIGTVQLEDSPRALLAHGRLVLEVARAKEAYSLLKAGALKGLSIGYRTVKEKVENGVRRILELELFEVSLVAFPALAEAQVTGVKSTGTDDDIRAFRAARQDMKRFLDGLKLKA